MAETTLTNDFFALAASLKPVLQATIARNCDEMEREAKEHAAVDTGSMQLSVYSDYEGHSGYESAVEAAEAVNDKAKFLPKEIREDDLEGIVAVAVTHGEFVEDGAQGRTPQPFFRPAEERIRRVFDAEVELVMEAWAR